MKYKGRGKQLRNREIAELFYEAIDILEYQQVEWKPLAYRKAAQMIENLEGYIDKNLCKRRESRTDRNFRYLGIHC
jgi:DNA polymerase (family X)